MGKFVLGQRPVSEVQDPQPNTVVLFNDESDNIMKIKFSDGSVKPLAYVENITQDAHHEEPFDNTDTIEVTHNLGKKPSVDIYDQNGAKIEGDVQLDMNDPNNKLTVTLSENKSGWVVCN